MTQQAPFAPTKTANRAEGDVDILVRDRFFAGQQHGVFVEVGAARPDFLSVSAHYRGLGWQIIAIEPNPEYAVLHEALGHKVLQYACGERDEDDVSFTVADSHGIDYANGAVSFESFSSLALKDSYAAIKPEGVELKQIKVNVRRLDSILNDHAPDVRQIDIVCVDVEGWELEVLSGLDFGKYKPKVLIVENMFFEAEYNKFMKERGYLLWKTVEFNEVYALADLITNVERFVAQTRSRGRRALRAARQALGRLAKRRPSRRLA